MNLSFGIVFLWLSMCCLYIAFRQGTAITPTQVIQEIVSGLTGQGGPQAPAEATTATTATGATATTTTDTESVDTSAVLGG